jgi:hypothetical protein
MNFATLIVNTFGAAHEPKGNMAFSIGGIGNTNPIILKNSQLFLDDMKYWDEKEKEGKEMNIDELEEVLTKTLTLGELKVGDRFRFLNFVNHPFKDGIFTVYNFAYHQKHATTYCYIDGYSIGGMGLMHKVELVKKNENK